MIDSFQKTIEDKSKENEFQIAQSIKHENCEKEQKQKTKRWQGINTSILIIPSTGLNSPLKKRRRRRRGSDQTTKKKGKQHISVSLQKYT